ncbi:hypothetical protein HDC35_000620 [Sphingopyxis sp. JAI128]|nr:hypothetical protein [Sphingopyxis sp. JAI128]
MDAETVAKGLSERECRWLSAVQHDVADDAGMVAWRAGYDSGGGFAFFARSHQDLIERRRNYADTKFVYILTPLGLAVREVLLRQ